MKYAITASLVALASVASAQLDKVPQCALQCFVPVLQSDGCSELTDFKCHCGKGAQLTDKVVPCVMKQCPNQSDQVQTLDAVQNICKDAGVPLSVSIPQTSVLAGSSAAAPASSAAAPASSAAASAASSAAAGASSAVASAASSAAGAASSAASKASSAAASATSAAGSAAGSARPSSTPTQFTGGAPIATQAAGLLGAAAIAMLAL